MAGKGAACMHELVHEAQNHGPRSFQGHFSPKARSQGLEQQATPGVRVERMLFLLAPFQCNARAVKAGIRIQHGHTGVQGRLGLCPPSGAQGLARSLFFKSSDLSRSENRDCWFSPCKPCLRHGLQIFPPGVINGYWGGLRF